MKKFVIASALASLTCFGAAAASADTASVKMVNGDGSELSDMCIAAVKSDSHGISQLDLMNLRCNGMSVQQFVFKTRQAIASKQTSYTVSMKDESDVSQLCMAAVQSEEMYQATKSELFGTSVGIEDKVLCNGMPIKAFARKYRDRVITASL